MQEDGGRLQGALADGGFGVLLRAWRRRAGLTQERLAERAGLGVRTIRYLERDRVRPLPGTVRLLADALGLDGTAAARLAAAARPDQGDAADDGPPDAAVPAALPVPCAQLPADVAGFAGRARQLAALQALLAEGQDGGAGTLAISALDGTAGVGKTALAVHWAHRVRGHFPDGQLYVNLQGWGAGAPLSPLRALALLLGGLGLAADRVPVEVEQAAGLYRSLLAGRRVLVVLDDARDAEQVRALLPGSPTCLVLVTSRDRLAGLVASHGARRLTLDVLAPGEAVALLGSILGRDRVAADPRAALDLAEACAFLPLALRIAAADLAGDPERPLAAHAARLRAGDRLAELAVDGGALDGSAVLPRAR